MHFAAFETLLEISVLVREMYVEGQKDQERLMSQVNKLSLMSRLGNDFSDQQRVRHLWSLWGVVQRSLALRRLAAPPLSLLSLDCLDCLDCLECLECLVSLDSQSLHLREVARVGSCLSSRHFDFPSYVLEQKSGLYFSQDPLEKVDFFCSLLSARKIIKNQ